jgi:Domain of unknown function (DUF3943)
MRNINKYLLLFIILLNSIDVQVYGYEPNRSPITQDIYGDTSPLLPPPVITIDLTTEQPTLRFQNKEKDISTDFGKFVKASLTPYVWNWTERLIIAPHNVKVVFTNFPGGWIDNISHWQDCKVGKCAYPDQRAPIWAPPLNDGDYFKTNYVEHPFSGAATYLYYRTMGFDRFSADFGSFMQSLIFEYTIEGFQQPPSLNDIIVTPLIGVPLGIVIEESSDWLAHRDSQFLRTLSYFVDPFSLKALGREVSFQNPGGISVRFNWY